MQKVLEKEQNAQVKDITDSVEVGELKECLNADECLEAKESKKVGEVALLVKPEKKKGKGKKAKTESKEKSEGDEIYNDLSELAFLLSTDVDALKKEFYFTQVRKIMSKLKKVIVRYDVTENELSELFAKAGQCGLGGIVVAPAYLPNSIRQNKKSLCGKINITSLIDFPFGESSLKGKLADIKESIKLGVSSVAVSLPSMMLNKENAKQLKKECRKYVRYAKKNAGIVLNASDVTEENFAKAIKVLNKTKINYIILAFGDATVEDVKNKLSLVSKSGVAKQLFVLANVENVETASELFKLGADSVLTPYADEIGSDLLKRFNLISK